eukprot:scaffold330293_cov64-Tisochrysis_lutea.AAC.1
MRNGDSDALVRSMACSDGVGRVLQASRRHKARGRPEQAGGARESLWEPPALWRGRERKTGRNDRLHPRERTGERENNRINE